MFECLIVGDSIAVGTHNLMPECIGYNRSGYTSAQWNKEYWQFIGDKEAKFAVISLGSNDYPAVDTYAELVKIRASIKAKRVYWIMPAIKWEVQNIITYIANKNGDSIIKITGLTRDGVHPNVKGYNDIVTRVRVPYDNR